MILAKLNHQNSKKVKGGKGLNLKISIVVAAHAAVSGHIVQCPVGVCVGIPFRDNGTEPCLETKKAFQRVSLQYVKKKHS